MRSRDVAQPHDAGGQDGLPCRARASLPTHVPFEDLAPCGRGIDLPKPQQSGLHNRRNGSADEVVAVGAGIRVTPHAQVANLAPAPTDLGANHPSIASIRTSAYG